MKGFLNSPETLVIDSLEGLLHGQEHLARLDGFPNVSDRLQTMFAHIAFARHGMLGPRS